MARHSLLIIGAGGHGKVVANAAHLTRLWDRIAFIDNKLLGNSVNGTEVIGGSQDLVSLKPTFTHAIVAIGDANRRMELLNHAQAVGYSIATVIHPHATVAENVMIEEGTVVLARAVVNPSAHIGRGVIINTGSIVEHDCCIGHGVHICPGVTLGGGVVIGAHCWIGIGSCIKHQVSIAANVCIGAGAAVVKDIKEQGTFVGVPAKRFKYAN